jgi:hypothetical protein
LQPFFFYHTNKFHTYPSSNIQLSEQVIHHLTLKNSSTSTEPKSHNAPKETYQLNPSKNDCANPRVLNVVPILSEQPSLEKILF